MFNLYIFHINCFIAIQQAEYIKTKEIILEQNACLKYDKKIYSASWIW